MENSLRQYIYEIGSILGKLGNDLCQQANNTNQPLLRKYRYFADKDSVVLYGFYPQAYTPESKNERWTIRKLTSDSLVVYVHNPIVVLDGDTLNTVGDNFETFIHKH